MIDPVEALKTKTWTATSSLLVPTSSPSHVKPLPTITPSIEWQKVGEAGAKTLWVVFVIMLLSTLAFIWMAFRTPVQKRLFHVLTAFITTFATISYFAMATGDGNSFAETIVRETHKHNIPTTVIHVFRQVFWARYIDWSVTTPLLLLELAFLAGMNGANILVAIVADVIMVLLGLFSAFGSTDGQKWGYYAIACIAYFVIVYQLVVTGRQAVTTKDSQTAKLFASIGGFLLILWTLYPIVWGIGDGARKWSVDTEIIAYAVLDVLAKPVFGFWLLFAHGRNAVALDGFWSRGLSGEGSIRIDDDEGA